MAASDNIGNVTEIYLKSSDQLGNQYETRLTSFANGYTKVNPSATYSQVDSATRLLNSLTQNNYRDTILLTAISVTEEMVEE